MVSLKKSILFVVFITTWLLNSLLFVDGEIDLTWNLSILVLSIILTLLLYRIFYLRDTAVDSPFFSIDRVRSIRFALVYFSILTVGLFLVALSLPFMIVALVGLVIGLAITILNVLIVILLAILFIFGGSIDFIGYDYAIELPGLVADFLFAISDISVLQIIATLFLFIIPITLSSYFLAKYIEDVDSGLAVILQFFLILSLFMYEFGLVENIRTQDPVVDLLIIVSLLLLPILSLIIMNLVFARKEEKADYDLPEVNKYLKFTLFLIQFLLTIGSIGLHTGFFIFEFSSISAYDLGILQFSLLAIWVVITHLLMILMCFWIYLGDFPVDIRIFEIEYREELLEKAREFKEM